jgi:D-alanyl-D-alanine carboxypeptidase
MEQLLCHTGGVPAPGEAWGLAWQLDGSGKPMPVQRAEYLSAVLSRERAGSNGAYLYSNEGYSLAGHLLELHCGVAYEELLRQRLFEPLGMATAGTVNPSPTAVPNP